MSATSGEITIGLDNQTRTSSRVLKPPGGGHSNIFAEPDTQAPKARPKYNQQNSSNLNHCMNTTDPNELVAAVHEKNVCAEPVAVKEAPKPIATPKTEVTNGVKSPEVVISEKPVAKPNEVNDNNSGRVRVPPGGFSSGLW